MAPVPERPPPAAGPTFRRRLGASLVVVGAIIVAGSGFLVWLRVLGSELTGYRLAEVISAFGGDLPGGPPGWVGVVWYLIPALAAVCWILVFARSPVRASPVHGLIGAVLVAASVTYLVGTDVQAGPLVAVVGGALVLVGGVLAQLGARRPM